MKKKKQIEGFIYRVEELSSKAKVPIASIYRKIYSRTGEETLLDLAKRIEKGENKVEVYREFLPHSAYIILREGERRGISSGHLLSKYAEYISVYKEMKDKFRGTLLFQVIYFGMLAVAGYFLLQKVGTTLVNTKQVSDPSFYYAVKALYIPVNILIFLLLLFTALFPDKIVKVRDIFKEIEAVRILGLTTLLYRAGSSISDIILFFAEDKSVSKYFSGIKEFGIEGFLEAMEKLLPPEEVAVLEVSFETAQFIDGLERLAQHKLKNAQGKVDAMLKKLQMSSIALGVIPILFVLFGNGYLINDILKTVLSKMQRY